LTKQSDDLNNKLNKLTIKLNHLSTKNNLEDIKQTFYKNLVNLNNYESQLTNVRNFNEVINKTKDINEIIKLLKPIKLEDLNLMRDIYQYIVNYERKMNDILLELSFTHPHGLYNYRSDSMALKWNHDMNCLIAVLLELSNRHYESDLNNSINLRKEYNTKLDELNRFKVSTQKKKEELDEKEKTINQLTNQINTLKENKKSVYEEVNNVLKEQYEYKLNRSKFDYEKILNSYDNLINKLKLALKEDNKTIIKLSNSIVTMYNKYNDFNNEIKSLKFEIEEKDEQLNKLYN